MLTFYFVPARAGSTRVLNKNFAPICGKKSLVDLKIQGIAPFASKPDDVIVLSTDASVTLNIPVPDNLIIHRRKPEHATATSSINEAIEDFVSKYDEPWKMLVLNPTSPFLSVMHIVMALNILSGDDAVLAVTEVTDRSYFQGQRYSGLYMPFTSLRPRTQDVTVHEDCGALYGFTSSYWTEFKKVPPSSWKDRLKPTPSILLDQHSAFDINTPHDFMMAKMFLSASEPDTPLVPHAPLTAPRPQVSVSEELGNLTLSAPAVDVENANPDNITIQWSKP